MVSTNKNNSHLINTPENLKVKHSHRATPKNPKDLQGYYKQISNQHPITIAIFSIKNQKFLQNFTKKNSTIIFHQTIMKYILDKLPKFRKEHQVI